MKTAFDGKTVGIYEIYVNYGGTGTMNVDGTDNGTELEANITTLGFDGTCMAVSSVDEPKYAVGTKTGLGGKYSLVGTGNDGDGVTGTVTT
jgi:hypothetical protein